MSESREIARAAVGYSFDPQAVAMGCDRQAVVDAIDGYKRELMPAAHVQQAQRATDQQTLAKIIGSIGARIRPEMEGQTARLWTAAMVDALENLPLRVSIAGAKDCRHDGSIQHPSQVLEAIQKASTIHHDRQKRALANLERLLREIDYPTPRITGKPEPKMEEIPVEELGLTLRESFLRVGILKTDEDGSVRYATEQEWEDRQAAIRNERHSRARKEGNSHEA